ncbi:response regulator [uncultured Paraglaciecola sp.]|uniref:response regulator n=1 Tax=uncultured Paraglaciecola sp. TaxID=1765024 RepID=UPI0030DCBD75|tara:strand:- start:20230 stop:21162 length:933 start_codon:yes stop_codon:yes gene_type:complete
MIDSDSLSLPDTEMLSAVVLVVDDEPSTAEFLVQALTPYYRTFSAQSGEDAIGFCAAHAPDLVILDLHMPVLDGLLTCKMLKAIPSMLNCPIVFSTDDTSTEQEIKCWDAGGTDFVCKPIVIQTLVKRIRSHIQIKMQQDLIENMVFIDPQTGLYNRRYFNDCYERQISLAKRNDAPLSLLMFEVKSGELFETQTSPVAARHIKIVAELILKELSRPTDTLIRFSETELAVLLPDTYIFGAKHITQKVMTAMSELQNASDDSIFEQIDISAGMASLEALQKNTNLIELVEKNLLQNKLSRNGKVTRYQFN